MDAFEQIVARVFDREGYWIKQSYKIDLSKPQKTKIGTPTMPRAEIDLLAFEPANNLVYVIECKSYLDSTSISLNCFNKGKRASRFKLFNDPRRRRIVLSALRTQLIKSHICNRTTKFRLGLVAGNVRDSEREAIHRLFKAHDWDFWDDKWIADSLRKLSDNLYENSVVDMTVKLVS